ncbi:unnamed protein product [Calypogeia fissa]
MARLDYLYSDGVTRLEHASAVARMENSPSISSQRIPFKIWPSILTIGISQHLFLTPTVGSIAEALLAWIIIPNINWRWLVAVSALPFILLLAFYPVLPESPRYLMMKGDGEGARKILQRIAKANGKSLPPGMLTLLPVDSVPISKNDQSTLPSEEVDTVVDIGGNAKQPSFKPSESSHAGVFDTFKLLFSPELKRSTLLLWFLFFAYYGLVLLTTELQVKGSTLHACKDPSNLGSDEGTECHIDGRPIIETSQYRTVLITCIAELRTWTGRGLPHC